MARYYIAYFAQGFPGEQASDPTRHGSIPATERAFAQFAKDVGRDYWDANGTAHAFVYGPFLDSDENSAWEEAERLRGIGSPFDYHAFHLEIGKRGGIVREDG